MGPPPPPPRVTRDLVDVSFARSGGAGGQNVNKVSGPRTRAEALARCARLRACPDGATERTRPPTLALTMGSRSISARTSLRQVNTKADMRFNVLEADWIDDKVKDVLLEREANRINNEGELVITSTKHRTQSANVDDALKKMQVVLNDANKAAYPREASAEKKKKIKGLAKKANQRRLDNK